MESVYVVEGQGRDTGAWTILSIFKNYPSAVKYAEAIMKQDEWVARIRTWQVND